MNLSTRAAAQLRNLEPGDVAAILDTLRDRSFPERERATLVEVEAPTGPVRCFVARHRDGSLVLLAVVETRPRGP